MKHKLRSVNFFLSFNPVKIIAKQSHFMTAISTTADCICPSLTLHIGVLLLKLWLHSPALRFLSKPSASQCTKIRCVTHLKFYIIPSPASVSAPYFLHFLIHLSDSARQPSFVHISILQHICTYLPPHFSTSNSISAVLPASLPLCTSRAREMHRFCMYSKNISQCLRGSQGTQNHEGPKTCKPLAYYFYVVFFKKKSSLVLVHAELSLILLGVLTERRLRQHMLCSNSCFSGLRENSCVAQLVGKE